MTDIKDPPPDYLHSRTLFEGLAMSSVGFSIKSEGVKIPSSRVCLCAPNKSSACHSHVTARTLGDEGASLPTFSQHGVFLIITPLCNRASHSQIYPPLSTSPCLLPDASF